MLQRRIRGANWLLSLAAVGASSAAHAVSFDWVTIENEANAPDTLVMNDQTSGYGGVVYKYRLATTEVTVAQYAEFLNSVASIDSHGLYNTSMANPICGITRSGAAGAWTYSVVSGREDHPVVYVSFLDAIRFVNWLHNGQGDGDTETGAYHLANGLAERRCPGTRFFLPSEDEWYKGAYHQPAGQGGDTDDYWLYPTSSNSVPVAGVDANYGNVFGDTSPVGSFAPNFYGLFDMGGNVLEWNEGLVGTQSRSLRGGTWNNGEPVLRASVRFNALPTAELPDMGFRVASPIPACLTDINGDGITDTADLSLVIGSFGDECP